MKKQLLIYVHGFGGSGFSNKAQILRQRYEVLSLSLPFQPNLAINNLQQTIQYLDREKYDPVLVGSSLGGYYSIYLGNKYQLRTILINPSIQPQFTAQAYLGLNKSFYDQSQFEWKTLHTDSLWQFEVPEVKNQNNFLLLLTTGDEILDYQEALRKLPNAQVDIQHGGDHEYKMLGAKLEIIDQFLKKGKKE